MAYQIISWDVTDSIKASRLSPSRIDFESELERWIDSSPEIVSSDWLPICARPVTVYGTIPDYLGLDVSGNLVVVELKREKTPREAVAQLLEYTAWVSGIGYDEIISLATAGDRAQFDEREGLKNAFKEKFGVDLPEVLNEQQRAILVATEITTQVAQLIEYLSENYSVPINAVQLAKHCVGDRQVLSRTVILSEDEFSSRSLTSKRQRATKEVVLDKAKDNGAGEIARTLLSRLSAPPFQRLQFSTNGFGAAIERDGSLCTPVSVDVIGKDASVILRFTLANLVALSQKDEQECEEFVANLPGDEHKKTPTTRQRTCSDVVAATKLIDETLLFCGVADKAGSVADADIAHGANDTSPE